MSAKPAGESLENARKLYSIYARTAQYFGECFLYNSNSILCNALLTHVPIQFSWWAAGRPAYYDQGWGGLRMWLPSYRLSVFLIFLPRTTTFSSWLACLLLSPRFVFLLEDWHLLVSTGFCFSTPSKSLSVCSWSSCCSVLRAWISDTLRSRRFASVGF